MKRTILALLIITALSAPVFAMGPVPVNFWLGAAGGSLGAGMNVGMDIGLSLPVLPSIILEAESSGMIIPLVLVNAATSSQRVGIAGRFNIIGDILKFKVGVGAATVSTDTRFIWGDELLNKSYSTYYVSFGPEISLLFIGAYAKAVFMPLPQATVGEIDLGLLASF